METMDGKLQVMFGAITGRDLLGYGAILYDSVAPVTVKLNLLQMTAYVYWGHCAMAYSKCTFEGLVVSRRI